MILAFDDHQLDIARRELRRGMEPIDLAPQVFDLLAFLIRNRDRVVSKDDLLEGVWDGRIVSESAITTRINELRRMLGDDGATQRLIRTFARKGVRFMGEVTEKREVRPLSHALPVEIRSLDKPSIAVLPFQNLSDDPSLDYFAEAMGEEVITALSRIRWLSVIGRNSSFTGKGHILDAKRVGRELGVRYAIGGSVRKSGKRARVTTQLVETMTGWHLWADRFDGSFGEIFDLQDQVASSVAGAIEPVLQAAETTWSRNHSTSDLSAYEAHLRGYAMLFTSAKQIPQALVSLERAIARDPNYGPALAFAAHCCMRLCMDGSTKHLSGDSQKGVGYARRALRLAGDDPGALATSAFVLAFFGEDIGAMIALVDRALMLNPSFARGWHISAMLRSWSGKSNIAIEHAQTALQLSPRGGIGSPHLMIGTSQLLSRRFDEALASLLLAAHDLPPDFPSPYRLLVACYTHMGRLDDAREVVQRLRGMTQCISDGFSYVRSSEHRDLLLSGLRTASGETRSRSIHRLAMAASAPLAPRGSLAGIVSLHPNDLDIAAPASGPARGTKVKGQAVRAKRENGSVGAG